MTRYLVTTATIAVLGFALSACGGGGRSMNTTVTPPPAAAPFEDQFGAAGFGVGFRAGANTDPRDIAPGDIIPLSLTADPVSLPGT